MFRPGVFWHLLWPSLGAIVVWTTVLLVFWKDIVAGVIGILQHLPLVGDWMGSTVATVGVQVLLFLGALPLVYVTASVLVAVIALPMMLEKVAASDYPDLERRRGGTQLGSIANSVWAVLLFIVALLLSLPFWLIPGVGVVLSLLLAAWLNQRCYCYDALMNHADAIEIKRLPKDNTTGIYAIGIGSGVLAFVPLLNLFVPALTGLVFVHFLLEALRQERLRPMRTI